MGQKHLHELLREDQEPFQLKRYIADRRCQLKNLNIPKSPLQAVKKKQSRLITSTETTSTSTSMISNRKFSKHACFLSFHDSPDVRKSPFNFPSPAKKSPCRNSTGKVVLPVPARTASLLLEAAMRIQKQHNPKPKTQINKVGFGLFGSLLKKLKDRNRNKKRELKNSENGENRVRVSMKSVEQSVGLSCSCNNSRNSSAGWSESNEEKSMDFESSSSCRSESEEIEVINGDFDSLDNCYCTTASSPQMSPFRFSLQRCPSPGRRTPDFSSPTASPIRRRKEDKENYETIGSANTVVEEEDEKEQCSPVSVLDRPFEDDEDDDGHEGVIEDEEDDDCDRECSYALVQRAQQQLLYKLRRFEKMAELDPIELEKLMLEEEEEGDDDLEEEEDCQEDDDDDLVSTCSDRDFDTFASEVMIPFDMKRLVSDLISEEKTESNSLNNREVVFGRVSKRLDSWQDVTSNTIDMMVESDLRTEFDDWKKFQDQREDTAMEIEFSIFRLLVEELAEELVHSNTKELHI